MAGFQNNPRLTARGIIFMVDVDGADRSCFISKDTLHKLSLFRNIDTSDAEPLDIFRAFEKTISTAARQIGRIVEADEMLSLYPGVFQRLHREQVQDARQ